MTITDLPDWLTNDGTEESMARVLARIAGREQRLRATAPKPMRPLNVARCEPLPPAGIRFSESAWLAVHPQKPGAPVTEWFRWGELYLTGAQAAMLEDGCREGGLPAPTLTKVA